jgi:hypothetical protein
LYPLRTKRDKAAFRIFSSVFFLRGVAINHL